LSRLICSATKVERLVAASKQTALQNCRNIFATFLQRSKEQLGICIYVLKLYICRYYYNEQNEN